jgi:dihydroneopterin aldolase
VFRDSGYVKKRRRFMILKNKIKLDYIFIDRLTINGSIGIYDHERESLQPIVVSVRCGYMVSENLGEIICYKNMADAIEALIQKEHTDYVEELAERIAALCLLHERAQEVTVRVEKPNAIPGASSAGVEITRYKRSHP